MNAEALAVVMAPNLYECDSQMVWANNQQYLQQFVRLSIEYRASMDKNNEVAIEMQVRTTGGSSTPAPPPPPNMGANNNNNNSVPAPPPAPKPNGAPPPAPAGAPKKVQATISVNSDSTGVDSIGNDPEVLPFLKMLKVGVPEQAVRNKMWAAGFQDDAIDDAIAFHKKGK
eukprot:CAMPEP_0114673652 /NCGR_PEP_ID=MMETSP0191-20121206/45018_1 /TAXON_ID=126664 /ORGANISM="Sorites sp." /LENGTH=170 /DNA_ID=CAMNT_0001939001 /DNA_START=728 /DNA_END=1240 /DNA_ORIENTATION=+